MERIDGVAEYGAKAAEGAGFWEMAEDMEKHIGISEDIEKIVEPAPSKLSHDWEMEV